MEEFCAKMLAVAVTSDDVITLPPISEAIKITLLVVGDEAEIIVFAVDHLVLVDKFVSAYTYP